MKTVIHIIILFLIFSTSSFSQIQRIYTDFGENFRKHDFISSYHLGDKYLLLKDANHSNAHIDLVVSDGTTEGTIQLDEIREWHLRIFKNRLYYKKYEEGRYKMYVTDGTVANTVMFLDSINNHNFLLATPDELFFMKNNQLWKTEGTPATTYSITDSYGTSADYPASFKYLLGKVYFTTADNHWMIEQGSIQVSSLGALVNSFIFNGVELNGVYYFTREDDTHGLEFWRTDGTLAGTYLVKNLLPEQNFSGEPRHGIPRGFAVLGNMIYFASELGIWKSDGTNAGTVLVKPIENINHTYYSFITYNNVRWNEKFTYGVLNDKYFIELETTNHGREIWISDGTADGTFPLDIFKGSGYGLERADEEPFTILDSYLYFPANDGSFGKELWRTDGTPEGTTIVKDFTHGIKSSEVIDIRAVGDKLFFISQYENQERTALYSMDKNSSLPLTTINYPNLDWKKTIGGVIPFASEEMMNGDLELDATGNVYVSGHSRWDAFVGFYGDEGIIKSPTRDGDISFVAKYNANGDLQWHNYAGGDDFASMSLAIDEQENVFVGGLIPEGNTYFDFDIPFFGENKVIKNANKTTYLVKLNSDGEREWDVFLPRQYGWINDILLDNNENLYVLLERALMRYDTDGNLIWEINLTNTGTKRDGQLRLLNGFLYLATSSDGSTGYLGYLNTDFLDVMKYTLDGQQVWAKKVSASDFLAFKDFEISPEGHLSVIGEYSGVLSAFPFQIISSQVNAIRRAGFFLRMNSDGQPIRLINDTLSKPQNIAFNDQQQYYIIKETEGDFFNSNPYEGFEGFRDFHRDHDKLTITKYDYLHQPIEERTFYTGTVDNDPKIVLTPDEKIILSGAFWEQFDTLPLSPRNNERNLHILKFSLENLPSSEPTWEVEENLSVNIFPNPSRGIVNIRVIDSDFTNYSLQIFDAKGRAIDYFEKLNDAEYETYRLSDYSAGVYFFQFQSGERIVVKKVVILYE